MKNILVSDIMTRDPITVKPETSLLDCAKVMVKKRVGSLLLVDGKRLVGYLSRKDILWALIKKSKADLSKIRAIDISPRKIATTKPNSTVEESLQKMKKLKFEKLPVLQDNELVGIISIRDILNFQPEIYPELDEFEKIRDEEEKLKRVKMAKSRTLTNQGICEECGTQDILFKVDGRVICEDCKNLM